MASKELHFAKFINLHHHGFHENHDAHSNIFAITNLSLKDEQVPQFFSIGIHPWEVMNDDLSTMKEVELRAMNEKCLMIGESGLDFFRPNPRQAQILFFKEHIKLSEKLKIPLIIHCVRALDEILVIHNEMAPQMPWVLHDFNGSVDQITKVLKRNIYFSLGPTYLRPNSKIHKFAKHLDINKIFFESDDHPIEDIVRGYQKYSEQMDISIDDLKIQIDKNFKFLLNT